MSENQPMIGLICSCWWFTIQGNPKKRDSHLSRWWHRKKHPTVFCGKILGHCGSCSIILSIFITHQYSLIRSVWISSFIIIYLVLDRLQCVSLRLIVTYIFSRGVELNVEKSSTQNTVQQPKNNNISTRWWFWIFYSPRKLGKIPNLTSMFFRWFETTN